MPLPYGPEPLEPADRLGAEAEPVRRAGHDRTAAPRSGGPDPGGEAGGRDGDRRGLRRGRPQGPTRGCCQKGRSGRRRKLRGIPGRGTLEKDKPPILGLIQRGGQVVLRRLANVQQRTIEPVITGAIAQGTLIHTDASGIYARLGDGGYQHKTVCHARGEYARDEDGDGFCEVHVNTIEGSGPCCAPGSARTGVSRKTSCRSISASSRSCTTHAVAAKPCSARSLRPWSCGAQCLVWT